ncbi:MAG TPA: VPLPA-CTERM sorting domain-containing protein [Steroidobacteraceae bacterium]|nr:VPLPA-CTERM sorting domain-containing protein [Steroidobacteraceae bacterium]
MNRKLISRMLLGALALSAAGSVLANTNIANGQTGNGSLFLNVVDTTNSTSFVFDTGLHLNSFTGTASISSFNLASDPNWQTFISGAGTDALLYNVVAENSNGSTNTYNVDFTSNALTGTQVGRVGSTSNDQLTQVSSLDPFINAINLSTSSTTNSLFVTDLGANANDAAYFGSSFTLGSGFQTTNSTAGIKNLYALGTATNFYELSLNGDGSDGAAKALVSTFKGQWNLTAAGLLSYTVAAVPLPDSLAILLSGLALMGLIARRARSGRPADFVGAAA